MTPIPYLTKHAMTRFVTRGGQLNPSAMQRFLRANKVCRSISRRYTRSQTEQSVRYDDELIFLQDVSSGAVVTIMQRGENYRWNAMIMEQESLRVRS